MASNKLHSDCVEWRPKWEGEDLEYYNEVRKEIEPKLSVLRVFRERLNLSQVRVAEILGTSQSNVSKMEKKGETSLSTLRRLASETGAKVRVVFELPEGTEIDVPV
jgi:transcriptional regulator